MHRHYIAYNYIKLHVGLSFIKTFFFVFGHTADNQGSSSRISAVVKC